MGISPVAERGSGRARLADRARLVDREDRGSGRSRSRGAARATSSLPIAAVAAPVASRHRRRDAGAAGRPPARAARRRRPARGPGAAGQLVRLAPLGQGRLARQLHPVLVVDRDRLDQHGSPTRQTSDTLET